MLLSTILQGLTIEPVARWLGVTTDEAAIPAPLVEPVLLNRLGAETMQFPVRESDAINGHPVRELGLPREALLNVIVRGDRAIPPRARRSSRRATSCTCSSARRSRSSSAS